MMPVCKCVEFTAVKLKCKPIVILHPNRNLNLQCRQKASGHIFVGDLMFFWSAFPWVKVFLAHRSLLPIRFEMHCIKEIT